MNNQYENMKKTGRANRSIVPDKHEQAVDFHIAVGFSQRMRSINSSGLQPHIIKMWLKPVFRSFTLSVSYPDNYRETAKIK
jgi:hypothetical protein